MSYYVTKSISLDSYWLICEETRNEVEVNTPPLVLWDYLVFVRWRAFGCKGGHGWVGIVPPNKIDMFGYKAHEWFESKKENMP